MNNKIAIIGTVGVPAKYGGFETLTEYLTKHLGDSLDLAVFCSSKSYKEKLLSYNNARLIYIPLNANGVQSIAYDIVSMFKALCFADTFLILGVSGCIILPLIRFISGKKVVVNIDGLEWKRDKWNRLVKWFLKFSERIAVKFSDEVITDNKTIQNYVIEEYGTQSNLIAYGADHAAKEPLTDKIKKVFPFVNKAYAFTVCRIEPENNIHTILEAFSHTSFPLVIVGNWENSKYGSELKSKFLPLETVHLCDPIYDQKILNQLRSNAALYIHGHSAGGTNPSLVEAMYLGLSIIAFDVDYNRETTENKAEYFQSSIGLQEIVQDYPKSNQDSIGQKMNEIAIRRYTWEAIVKKYEKVISRGLS